MEIDAECLCPLFIILKKGDNWISTPVIELIVEALVNSNFVDIQGIHDLFRAISFKLVAVTTFINKPEGVVEPHGKILVLCLILRDNLVETSLS